MSSSSLIFFRQFSRSDSLGLISVPISLYAGWVYRVLPRFTTSIRRGAPNNSAPLIPQRRRQLPLAGSSMQPAVMMMMMMAMMMMMTETEVLKKKTKTTKKKSNKTNELMAGDGRGQRETEGQ